MIAKVDKNKCIGCGLCASVCPKVFEMDADGLAIAIPEPVPAQSTEEAQDACDSCPVEAITLK